MNDENKTNNICRKAAYLPALVLSVCILLSSCSVPQKEETVSKSDDYFRTSAENEQAVLTTKVSSSNTTKSNYETTIIKLNDIKLLDTSVSPRAVLVASTTAAKAKPADIVIPKVKAVTSPGTKTLSSDNAVVDYSNVTSGYISVKYTGKSAKAKLRMICGTSIYDHNINVDGSIQYFPVSQGDGEYTIQVFENVSGKSYASIIDKKITVKISNSINIYLYPNKYVGFVQDSKLVKKAAEVCSGYKTTIDKISAIFKYITDNVTYDTKLASTVKSGYVPDPDSVLSKKTGICFDYSSLFAAMARSQGIPARLVIGYASPEIYHAWNEIYTEKTGWISLEVYLKNKGFNLLDSTFYASAKNKQKIADYMADKTNYSAVYIY